MTHPMTPELTVLALAALLQVLQLFAFSLPANLEVGTPRLLRPRDDLPDLVKDLSKRTARLGRAHANHNEGLLLFAIAALLITVTGQGTGFTAACAWVYLIARVLYVPAYAFGWVPWRSVVWGAGLFATIAMLLAALF